MQYYCFCGWLYLEICFGLCTVTSWKFVSYCHKEWRINKLILWGRSITSFHQHLSKLSRGSQVFHNQLTLIPEWYELFSRIGAIVCKSGRSYFQFLYFSFASLLILNPNFSEDSININYNSLAPHSFVITDIDSHLVPHIVQAYLNRRNSWHHSSFPPR